MGVRKARAYTHHYTRPSTRRSAKKGNNYIKTVPTQKISKFHMGDTKRYLKGGFPILLTMQSKETAQIRDLAIEAVRQYLTKELEEKYLGQFYLGVKIYPHHIQRNHKVLTGAGADRMAIGMAHSYGSSEGRAALVGVNHPLFVIGVNDEKAASFVRFILKQIKAKLPCTTRIVTEMKGKPKIVD